MVADSFDQCFAIVVGHEGGYTTDPQDPGNWTGGAVGQGRCLGTKYGISAASYPTTNIADLTLNDAKAIYRRDYWQRAACDACAPMLALILFDAAVNNGVGRAVRWVQGALGVAVDGIVGNQTRGAITQQSEEKQAATATEMHAQRIYFMAGLSTWSSFGLGWSRRLANIPAEAAALGLGASANV